jgi:hypothetical protein
MTQFRKDLEAARASELLVYNYLLSLGLDGVSFELVNDNPAYYHKGDIIARAANKEIGIDVKCDSRIAETSNVLCEEENFFFDN